MTRPKLEDIKLHTLRTQDDGTYHQTFPDDTYFELQTYDVANNAFGDLYSFGNEFYIQAGSSYLDIGNDFQSAMNFYYGGLSAAWDFSVAGGYVQLRDVQTGSYAWYDDTNEHYIGNGNAYLDLYEDGFATGALQNNSTLLIQTLIGDVAIKPGLSAGGGRNFLVQFNDGNGIEIDNYDVGGGAGIQTQMYTIADFYRIDFNTHNPYSDTHGEIYDDGLQHFFGYSSYLSLWEDSSISELVTIGELDITAGETLNLTSGDANDIYMVSDSGFININSARIGNASDPIDPQDYVTVNYYNSNLPVAAFTQEFNSTSDWTADTGIWYIDFAHNYDSFALLVELWDETGTPVQTFADMVIETDSNTIRVSVPDTPDSRFAGRIVISIGSGLPNSIWTQITTTVTPTDSAVVNLDFANDMAIAALNGDLSLTSTSSVFVKGNGSSDHILDVTTIQRTDDWIGAVNIDGNNLDSQTGSGSTLTIHSIDSTPWALSLFNDTFSVSNAGWQIFVDDDGSVEIDSEAIANYVNGTYDIFINGGSNFNLDVNATLTANLSGELYSLVHNTNGTNLEGGFGVHSAGLLEFSINANPLPYVDNSQAGGVFGIDTRDSQASDFFYVHYAPAGGGGDANVFLLRMSRDGYMVLLDGAEFNGDVNVTGNYIINLADPVNPQDAVNLETLDDRIFGGKVTMTSGSATFTDSRIATTTIVTVTPEDDWTGGSIKLVTTPGTGSVTISSTSGTPDGTLDVICVNN